LKIVVNDEKNVLKETNHKENAGFLKIVYFWLIVDGGNPEQKIEMSNKIDQKPL